MGAIFMSELTSISKTDINLSISFGAKDQVAAGESKPAGRDVASRSAQPSGAEAIHLSVSADELIKSYNETIAKVSKNDTAQISIPARVLDFFVTAMKNNKVPEPVVNKNTRQYLDDPKYSLEMQKIYTLLEPFMGEGKEEFKKSIEKMLSTMANATSGTTSQQAGEAMQQLSAVVSRSVTATTGAGGEIQISSSVSISIEISVVDGRVKAVQKKQTDPLVVDVNGNGVELSSSENGVKFDIDGDGNREMTAAPVNGDALLALDRNENGAIDDGKELFGDQNGAPTGFDELKKYDDNNDNIIDEKDKIYAKLKLVKLYNNKPQEITSLKNAGIVRIDLSKIKESSEKINGSTLTHKSLVYDKEGSDRIIAEALFENFTL